MQAGQLPIGSGFCYRAAVTIATTTVVPARTGYRAVITGYDLSVNAAGATTVTVQTITANEAPLVFATGATTLSISNSGLWIPSSASEGWEIVGAGGAVTAGSITLHGVYIPNDAPYSVTDTDFTA